MSSAYPTIEADAKRFGFAHSRLNYPAGLGGVHLSLTEIGRRIYEGMRTPSIQQFAEMVIRQRVPVQEKLSHRRAAQILLDYVKANVRYRPDPPNLEMTKSATITLCVPGAQMCIPVGDCFVEGTLLLREDLTFVPVEKVEPGQRIWGRDAWTRVEAVVSKGVLEHAEVHVTHGNSISLTRGHWVYLHLESGEVDRVRVSDLQHGDRLLQPSRFRTDPWGGLEMEILPAGRTSEVWQTVDEVVSIDADTGEPYRAPCWDIQTADHYVYLPEHDVTVSNCDDLVVALGSLTAAYGIETRVIKQSFGGDQQEHVLIVIQDDDGTWLPADPSGPPEAGVGWKAQAAHEDVIDPSNPESIKLVGAHEAEFIGVGVIGRRITVSISPYAIRMGLGATPLAVSHFELVPTMMVQTGRRYRVGMLVNFLGVPADVPPLDFVTQLLKDDWTIETLAATGDVTGGIQSWILEGVSKKDQQLSAGAPPPAPFTISYLVVAVEVAGSGASTAPAAPATASSSVGSGDLALRGAAVVALGVLAWKWWPGVARHLGWAR